MVKPATLYLILILMFSGCAEWDLGLNKKKDGPPAPPPPPPTAYPFSDIPVPSNFSQDHSKSFIYESGSGSVKVGRLVYTGWESLENTIKFFQNEMVNNGWTLVNSIKHDSYTLNYEKEGWASSVNINTKLGRRTTVEIQAGPK